jgi:serine/threonine protein kinase
MNPRFLCMGCMKDKGIADPCPYCGRLESAPVESPLQLAPRTILNQRYLLGHVLGQGGFGITYLAWDLIQGRKLAIKEYFPLAISTRAEDRLTVSPVSAKSRPELEYGLKKFEEEGLALERLRDRPGIVSMVDFVYANGTAYIVMLYVEGLTFKQYVEERGGTISFEEALRILSLVMKALDQVHAAGMLHRDISPDNIYVENDGQTKILDFGATRYAMGEQSRSLSVILKPGYAPEEQYRSKGHQGRWTDIYALGATFYRAITGNPPPDAMDRLAQDELIPPSRLGVRMPAAAEAALLKALAVRAEGRFKTVAEFRMAIGAVSGRPVPHPGPVAPKPAPGPAARPKPVVPAPERLSKAFYTISIAASLGLWFIFSVMPNDPRDATLPALAAFAFLAAVVVMMVLLYKLWDSIQDGHARTSPGRAIGFLFIPFFDVYWLFQTFWGFARDYNRLVDRRKLKVSKLPESLFLASAIIFLLLPCSFWLPRGFWQAIGLLDAILLSVAVAKACDAVNALAGGAPSLSIASPGPVVVTPPPIRARRMLLRCTAGEFQGQDLPLDNGEILIGRNPKAVNWVFSSEEVSARHVRVWRDAGKPGAWVEDLNSTNGTFYREWTGGDTQWVKLSGRKLLPAGSRFRLGQDLAEFEVKTA